MRITKKGEFLNMFKWLFVLVLLFSFFCMLKASDSDSLFFEITEKDTLTDTTFIVNTINNNFLTKKELIDSVKKELIDSVNHVSYLQIMNGYEDNIYEFKILSLLPQNRSVGKFFGTAFVSFKVGDFHIGIPILYRTKRRSDNGIKIGLGIYRNLSIAFQNRLKLVIGGGYLPSFDRARQHNTTLLFSELSYILDRDGDVLIGVGWNRTEFLKDDKIEEFFPVLTVTFGW